MFVGSIVGFAGGKRCIPLGSHYTLHRRQADHQRVLLGRSIGRVVAHAAVAHWSRVKVKGQSERL